MIIFNLRLDLALVLGGTLPGKVGQRTVAGSLVLRAELASRPSLIVGSNCREYLSVRHGGRRGVGLTG